MRRSTAIMAMYEPEAKTGENLHWERAKEGYFSIREDLGLQFHGATAQDGTPSPDNPVPIQCVKAGTVVTVGGNNICDPKPAAPNDFSELLSIDNDGWISGTFPPAESETQYRCYIKASPLFIKHKKYNIVVECSQNDADATITFPNVIAAQICHNIWNLKLENFVVKADNKSYSDVLNVLCRCFIKIPAGSQGGFVKFRVSVVDYDENLTIDNFVYTPYISGGELTTPCDLYEGDIWWPMTGKVERHTRSVEITGTEFFYSEEMYYAKMVCAFLPGLTRQRDTPIFCAEYIGIHNMVSSAERPGKVYLNIIAEGLVLAIGYRGGQEECIAELKQKSEAGTPLVVYYRTEIPIIEQYDPQPIFAPPGTVNVLQSPVDLAGTLSATLPVRRTST